MNYCIVIPKYTDFSDQAYFFPIGIAYVASSLRNYGKTVVSFNMNYKDGSTYDILKKLIIENDIDVIATGGITSYYRQIREIFKIAKEIKSNIVTIGGGG